MRRILSVPVFCEVIMASVLLSACVIQAFTADGFSLVEFIGRLMVVSFNFIELFMFSHASARMKLTSEKISEHIFKSQWCDDKTDFRKLRSLMIISMQSTNIPIQLTALGFTNVNYESLLSVRNNLFYRFACCLSNMIVSDFEIQLLFVDDYDCVFQKRSQTLNN